MRVLKHPRFCALVSDGPEIWRVEFLTDGVSTLHASAKSPEWACEFALEMIAELDAQQAQQEPR